MKGRFTVLLMSLVALALVLSLVAMLAPDAGAQDGVTAPDGPAKWMRHNVPAAQGSEAATNANFISQQKTCCITVLSGGTTVLTETNAASVMPAEGVSRWFCMGYRNP